MITNANIFQPEAQLGVMAGAALTEEVGRSLSTTFVLPAASHSIVSSKSEGTQSFPAELVFPKFGYSLPTVIKTTWPADTQRLILQIELDEGVDLVWEMSGTPIENGDKILCQGSVGISVFSRRPRAHFVAATFQLLALLDEDALLQAPEPRLSASLHFVDTLATVGDFLRRRQTAYRLLIIEKAFGKELSIPQFLPDGIRSDIDFVYRAVIDRSFLWPFWQEAGRVHANQETRELLAKVDGTFPFLIEIGCFQQALLGQTLNLGEVNITVQNTALANPAEVERELQQLDGHSFQVIIQSLSGAANYEFPEAPRLPDSPWDEQTEQLVRLEDKLDEEFFEAGNRLAAASLAGLTEEEKAALTEPFILGEEAFLEPEEEN